MEEAKRGNRKLRTGVVVSDKMDKTVVVQVERKQRHPLYQKVIRLTNKLKAHDEKNECAVGDLVEIMETRPLSRDKRWRVIKVLGKGKVRLQELPKKKVKEEAVSAAPASVQEENN
ncbi:MAG: 30S ribosomal protein S17 [Candidatus Margulisbacteria bacterium]|nr:30S ribosomal protein S17 [Candidatus Margulisiibacteriota bacterium]